jgi:hypothetical protein
MMLSGLVKGTVDPAFLTHLGQRLRIAAFETMLTTLGSLDQIAAMQ